MIFAKKEKGGILPELKVTQRNRNIEAGNEAIRKQIEAYNSDSAAIEAFSKAIHKSDGSLKKSSKIYRAYNNILKDSNDRAKEWGERIARNEATLEDFNKEFKIDESALAKPETLKGSIFSGIKSVGSSILSTAGNMLIGSISGMLVELGISLLAKGWDYISNKQENAIARGQEALANYKQTQEDISTGSNWIDAHGERFEKLSQGVSSFGSNLSEDFSPLKNE